MEDFSESNVSEEIKNKISNFTKFHFNKKNRLVIITSGGTTVPLEAKTVRFIDNFSIGSRGSISGEQFISKSYAVLFLHRKRSLTPYERKLNNVNIFDLMQYADDASHDTFRFKESNKIDVKSVFDTYTVAKEENLLLNVEFTSVFDYLSVLEYACRAVECFQSQAMVYLAAAVSDFYIPKAELPEHKIQSTKDGLELKLKPVPKLLGKLRSDWCPNAYIVSFKLETDINILNAKCKRSMEKYKQNLVIGNILEDRKKSVSVMNSDFEVNEIRLTPPVQEIEESIIDYLVSTHSEILTPI